MICIAAVALLNPLGIEILKAALFPSATDWLAGLWRMVALIALGIFIVLSVLEVWIFSVIQRRRARRAVTPAVPAGPGAALCNPQSCESRKASRRISANSGLGHSL